MVQIAMSVGIGSDDAAWYIDVGRIAFATLLGALIGWERERRGREAGIRTYMATVLGACTFGLISQAIGDQGRIAAGIVTGIGFIGAGIILRDSGRITGLTTAATLWGSASVGLSAAYGIYHLALISALLIFVILEMHHLPGWKKLSNRGALHKQRKVDDLPLQCTSTEPSDASSESET
jgi:putative Mg2+ transporter-C (MgtC) family protein